MSLESAKKYGYISSLLFVISPIIAFVVLLATLLPLFTFAIVSSYSSVLTMLYSAVIALVIILVIVLATLILFFLAMHRLSKYYNEPKLFMYPLYALIIGFSGTICTTLIQLWLFPFSTYSSLTMFNVAPSYTMFSVLSLAISLIISISSGFLYFRTFNILAEKSGVDSFKTAGLLFIIGALLSIFIVGALIVWVSWIFVVIGFRRLSPTNQATQPLTTTVTGATIGQNHYCPNCGAENPSYAIYCKSCGKQLQ
jgi:uncharacterized membrane protein